MGTIDNKACYKLSLLISILKQTELFLIQTLFYNHWLKEVIDN